MQAAQDRRFSAYDAHVTLRYVNVASQLQAAIESMPVPPGLKKAEEEKPKE
jgi:hypothetical protein